MKVIVRHPQLRELQTNGVRTVQDLVRELGLNPETVLVIRGQDLLTRDVRLNEDDTVEVRSAISGGALEGSVTVSEAKGLAGRRILRCAQNDILRKAGGAA